MSDPVWRSGGCHCGAVRFEVAAADGIEVRGCTCSMCAKAGFIHLIVPESRFRIAAGQEALTSYRFNTGAANHLFCSTCGVKAFYRPRSNPDGWSANYRCLDDTAALKAVFAPDFDGQNWEANADGLTHLSKEDAA
jgi:hypothetical protein